MRKLVIGFTVFVMSLSCLVRTIILFVVTCPQYFWSRGEQFLRYFFFSGNSTSYDRMISWPEINWLVIGGFFWCPSDTRLPPFLPTNSALKVSSPLQISSFSHLSDLPNPSAHCNHIVILVNFQIFQIPPLLWCIQKLQPSVPDPYMDSEVIYIDSEV